MVKENSKRVLTSSEDESSTGEDTLLSEDETDYGTPVRPRQRFSSEETSILERAFKESARPTAEVKKDLAIQFGTLSNRIQIWFQNRRAKEKKISGTNTSTESKVSDKDTPRVKNPRVEATLEPIVPLRPNVYYTETPMLSGNDMFPYPHYFTFTNPQNIDPGVGSSRGYVGHSKRFPINEDNSAANREKKEEDEVIKKGKKRSSRNPKNL